MHVSVHTSPTSSVTAGTRCLPSVWLHRPDLSGTLYTSCMHLATATTCTKMARCVAPLSSPFPVRGHVTLHSAALHRAGGMQACIHLPPSSVLQHACVRTCHACAHITAQAGAWTTAMVAVPIAASGSMGIRASKPTPCVPVLHAVSCSYGLCLVHLQCCIPAHSVIC